jgi:hypothetical protein
MPFLIVGCADWFGVVGAHASPGDNVHEVIATEGYANGSYIVDDDSGDFVWTWTSYNCVYKRAWFKWEPYDAVNKKQGRGVVLVRMDYDYGPMMQAWERAINEH